MNLIDAISAYETADTALKGLSQADADAQAKAAAAAAAAAQTAAAKAAGIDAKRSALQALAAAVQDELGALPTVVTITTSSNSAISDPVFINAGA